MPEYCAQNIDRPWTDLCKITNQTFDRNKLAGLLIDNLVAILAVFAKQGFVPFMALWAEDDLLINKQVKLITLQNEICGIVKGVDDKGRLILEDENGYRDCYSVGEATLNGRNSNITQRHRQLKE